MITDQPQVERRKINLPVQVERRVAVLPPVIELPPLPRILEKEPAFPTPKPQEKSRKREKYLLLLLLLLLFVETLGILNWYPLNNGQSDQLSEINSSYRAFIGKGPIDEDLTKHITGVLRTIQSNINPTTYLAYSFTGDQRLQYWSVVYDNCIRALTHLQTGRPDLAKKIIDYFIDNTAIQKVGWVMKDGKIVRQPGWIVNIVDASEMRFGGRGIEHIAHTGPNAYLGISALHIYRATGEERYLNFARKQWELLKDLQNEIPGDPNYGGIRMGPMGNPENPREQRLEFQEKNPSFYQFYNGEHAADFKGFSNLMAKVDSENPQRYLDASKLIEIWDHKIYDKKKHLFYIGTTEQRYFDPNIGKWVEPGIIPMYPLDTSSLKISAYGIQGLEQFETNAAFKIRDAIDENFKHTVDIPGPDGKMIPLTGYDFVANPDREVLIRFIELGAYGDRKINEGLGRKPLVTDEWSNWVALADLRMADDLRKMGRPSEAKKYFASYHENAIVNGVKGVIPMPGGGLAYPYCHPLPYALNQPVGFGWNTHHKPYALIGGSARILGILRFDPFLINGGSRSTSVDIQLDVLGRNTGAGRAKSSLYTEAELYLRDAWRDVRIAQINGPGSEKYWKRALGGVQRMLSEHQDWVEVAKAQNRKASFAKEKYPLSGVANLSEADLEQVYRKYWALYHVGAAQFIIVMANAGLRDLAREHGNPVEEEQYAKQAMSAALTLKRDFKYAQSYDENGWLWQPVQALSEYVDLPNG